MGRDEQQRIVLLVEELFANSVTHGYGGDSDQPVWLTLRMGKDECHVVYEDRAPPHDPFAKDTSALIDAPVEDRRVGGLGIVFLAELSSSHTYERRGNRNVIELDIARSRTH
jgi:anti-sigma regulatory factor (Ser/Thr protein kinase)